MIAVAVASVGLYASVATRYGLGTGSWVAAAILVVFLAGYLLAASALLRRPGVAIPGLLGGLFVALASLTLSGFTFYEQIAPDDRAVASSANGDRGAARRGGVRHPVDA